MFGFDWASGDLALGGAAPLRPETTALVARMSTAPDASRVAAIDALIGALLSGAMSGANIWAKLDIIQIYAASAASDSLLNWKGAGFVATIGGGSPVFVADRGWFANGIDSFIDLGAAPADLANYQQNSACFGGWMRTPAGSARANSVLGTQTSSACTLNPRSSSNVIGGRINGSGADTSVASTDFYGLTGMNRPSATQIQSSRNGARGTLQPASSAARSTARFGFGRCNSQFVEGQICAFYAGAALTDAEAADLYAALNAYLGVVGVIPLVPQTRTLGLASAVILPDGSIPVGGAGGGMPSTGLARRGDGKWYVGNGLASVQGLCFTRLSADFATAEAEFTVASLGLGSPPGNGSVQGLCVDAGDPDLMWVVLKIGNGGTTTYLFSFNIATEQVVQAAVPLPTLSCNGVADDGVAGTLLISQDISQTLGGMIRVNKANGANTNRIALQTPGDTDQLFAVATTGGAFMAGELLLTAGANGAGVNGTVQVMSKADYGAYCTRRIDILTGADAIEGVVLANGVYYVTNDGATHPGAPVKNRVLRYAT